MFSIKRVGLLAFRFLLFLTMFVALILVVEDPSADATIIIVAIGFFAAYLLGLMQRPMTRRNEKGEL